MNVHDFDAVVGSTGDGVLDQCRLNAAMRGADCDLVKEVEIGELPKFVVVKMKGRVITKSCYHNALETIKALKSRAGSTKYVLGWWHGIVPTEHCFVKIGNEYYDPTGQMLFPGESHRYFTLYEFTRLELQAIARYLRETYRYMDHITICDVHRHLIEAGEIAGYTHINRSAS